MRAGKSSFAVILVLACASTRAIDRVKAYRDAHTRGDIAAEAQFLAPNARIWYEQKTGGGDPLTAGRSDRYKHWDEFFHSHSELRDWRVDGNAVTATVHETNDFYRLLDWKPVPYTMTWWLNADGLITGAMVQRGKGKATNRLDEFRAWANVYRPAELDYLMPGGKLDPTGDRAERWKAILLEWRASESQSMRRASCMLGSLVTLSVVAP